MAMTYMSLRVYGYGIHVFESICMAMTYMSFLLKYHLISVFLTEYLKQNLFRPMELELLPEDLSPYSTGNLVCVGHQTQMKSTQKTLNVHGGFVLSFALGDAKVPNANGFALQWNIGFRVNLSFFLLAIFPLGNAWVITICIKL